jgi:hypothetical protein
MVLVMGVPAIVAALMTKSSLVRTSVSISQPVQSLFADISSSRGEASHISWGLADNGMCERPSKPGERLSMRNAIG